MLSHIIAGLLLGYVVASLLESSLHRAIHHAGPQTRRFWAQYPLIGRPFSRAYFSHGIIHHRCTFRRDFLTQFSSKEEREELDRKLRDSDQGSLIRREQYGLTLRGVGVLWFNLPILPVVPLIGFVCGPWVLLGALPGLAAYSGITIFLHPYLHRPHDEVVKGCPPLLRWMLQTNYVKFLRRYHYLHHRYPDCNFNLLLGGDFLLGRDRHPTAQDWDEMRRLGLVFDDDKQPRHSTSSHGG